MLVFFGVHQKHYAMQKYGVKIVLIGHAIAKLFHETVSLVWLKIVDISSCTHVHYNQNHAVGDNVGIMDVPAHVDLIVKFNRRLPTHFTNQPKKLDQGPTWSC